MGSWGLAVAVRSVGVTDTMPLDTGGEMDISLRARTRRSPAKVETYMPTLQDGSDVGEALKTIREFLGLSLE